MDRPLTGLPASEAATERRPNQFEGGGGGGGGDDPWWSRKRLATADAWKAEAAQRADQRL